MAFTEVVVTIRSRKFRVTEPSFQDAINVRTENAKNYLGDARLIARTVKEITDDGERYIPLTDVLKLPVGITRALSTELRKLTEDESPEDAEKN